MALIVGLTGGIGSGKSVVVDYFSTFKVPIIDADTIAHELCQPTQVAFEKIREHFGDFILDDFGKLDRKKLRKIIFTNNKEKIWLESFLHPLIIKIILDWCRNINFPYCLVVAPLLLEIGMERYVDRVLVVDCSEKNQIERVSVRDNINQDEVKLILDQQLNREARLKLADDIIINDHCFEKLKEKVVVLHDFYMDYDLKV